MRKIEPELITGMGYIGDNPGVLYRMGGAGEQTVVTGNPALLENSKGNRGLESLTLYGKSTQMNTTGAQLFPFEVGKKGINFEVFEDGIVISCKKGTDIYAVGRPNATLESSYDDFPLLAPGEYYIYSDSKYVELLVTTFVNGEYLILGVSTIGAAVKIKVIAGYKFRILLRCREDVETKVKAIISKRYPTASNYEPYTGGKPSPSPQYPQEIKSVGQDGEIGVSVDGGNLIKAPFESRENPYKPGYTFTQNGVTFTVQDDMGIKVAGTNTSADKYAQFTAYYLSDDEKPKYPAGTYTFSEGATVQIQFASETINKNGTFTANEKFNVNGFYIAIPAGQSVNETVYPMLNIGSTALPYEPYKPAQTLIVPTPNGLPGIPVSSGGNYTDEKGQQWVADEIDLARGERVKWIGEYELTGKESVADFGLRPRVRMVSITIPDAYIDAENHGILKAVMSNKYKQVSFNEVGNNINLIARGQQRNICISIPTDIGIEDFKTDLSNQYASGHPVKVFYKLDTPIRTPLPPETIAAYKALRPYSPTTTVINDACAGMSVGYRRRK